MHGGDGQRPVRVGALVVEVVEERAIRVVVQHHPQLRLHLGVLVVGGDERQDVVVAQHQRVVELHLAEERRLLDRAEDLDRHLAAAPLAAEHLAKAAVADSLQELHLSRDRSLFEVLATAPARKGVLPQELLVFDVGRLRSARAALRLRVHCNALALLPKPKEGNACHNDNDREDANDCAGDEWPKFVVSV